MNKIVVEKVTQGNMHKLTEGDDSFIFRGRRYTRTPAGSILASMAMLSSLCADPDTLVVGNDREVRILEVTPSKEANPECWGLDVTDAVKVREKLDGKPVIVAVIDTGVDYNHPEFKGVLWTNPEDGKSHGYNAITDKLDPMDDHSHGTHCAGTIGGQSVGVCPNVQVMGCKFLSARGGGTIFDGMKAIAWAIDHGARITSNSWGGGPYEEPLHTLFKDSPDVLHICAAGNESNDNDKRKSYPASYDLPNVFSVAASDQNDELAYFSNYGRNVHLAAPGVDVYSSVLKGEYAAYSGTSMATPHVSGAAAAILNKNPRLTPTEVVRLLLAQADPVDELRGKTLSGARLNVYSSWKKA